MSCQSPLSQLVPDLTYISPFQLILCRRHGLFIPRSELDGHLVHHHRRCAASTKAVQEQVRTCLARLGPLHECEQDFSEKACLLQIQTKTYGTERI